MSKKSRAKAAAKVACDISRPPERAAMSGRWGTFLAGTVVVLAVLAVYFNSFSGAFTFDDRSAIADNPSIRSLGTAWWPSPEGTTGGRPILNLSFAFNYALGGMNVWGYHAFNLVVHALAALTLFGVVRRTLRRPAFAERGSQIVRCRLRLGPDLRSERSEPTWLALAVAVIWAVDPLQTEAVTYVSQRAEAMMGLFYLLTVYCFVRGAESQRAESRRQRPDSRVQIPEKEIQKPSDFCPLASGFWLLASVCSCLLGAMCKEIIATAPLMVFLYDRTFIAGSFGEAWRRRWRYYLGLAGIWLLQGRLTAGLGQRGVGFDQNVTWWHYALTSCRSVVLYCKLALWPHPLVFDYGVNIIQRVAEAAPYALVLGALVAVVIWALRYRPAFGFVGAWFFVILGPTSSVIPVAHQPMAEHRLYLSLAAVVTLVVLGWYRWTGRRGLIALAALAAGLGWLSAQRNKDYHSELAIWSDTLAKRPANERAHNGLGNVLAEIPGRLPDAIAAYEASIRINPAYAEGHYDLGVALGKAGQMSAAMAQYEEALRIFPGYAQAHKNLGAALAGLPGRLPEAIGHFEAALQLDPDDAEAHNNLGGALSNIPDRRLEAISHFETALRIKPDYAEAHYNLGIVLSGTPGRRLDAINEFAAAARINPNYLTAHCQLGDLLANVPGREAEAISEYEAATRIKPDFVEVHLNLGILLSRIPGRLPEAIAEYETALRINPNLLQAHTNLGMILANIPGRLPEAVKQFELALTLAPNSTQARDDLRNARLELQKLRGAGSQP